VLLRHASGANVFRYGLIVQALIGAVLLAGTWAGGYGLIGTVALLFGFLLCAGITYPNAAGLALEPFSKNVGSASALLGLLQLGFGAFAEALLGVFDQKGAVPMAMVMAVCSAVGLAILVGYLRVPAPSGELVVSDE
jgi:DHA1 family bicyclomycin/chloramphenicol resistance-like MFS transporter